MRDKLFQDLKDIQKEMVRILGEVNTLASGPMAVTHEMEDTWQPHCDVFRDEKQLVVVIDLAGVNKKSVHISTSREYLKISGERYTCEANDDLYYYTMEIESGRFERKIYFPDVNINRDAPTVMYEEGFLRVLFPIVPVREKMIEIEID